jgi:3-oxoacyl-[acyl-carrier protein] reductase
LGQPEDIADLMSYLLSPAARWMTGASVRMDGGEIKGI